MANAGTLEIDFLTNVARLKRDMDEAGRTIRSTSTGAAADISRINQQIERLSGVGKAITGAFGALGIAAIAREFVQMADSMRTVEARIKAVTAEGQNLADVQQQLVRISKENQVGIEATSGLYTKLSRPLRQLGADTQTVIDVTDAFGKALRVGGAGAEEASAATLQFAQAMASGVLRGDEFNSIAEASPRVLQAIAEGSGMAESALRSLAAEGKLTAGVVGGALLKEMVALETESMRIPQTVAGTFTNFKTDLMLTAAQLNTATGLTQVFGTALGAASTVVRMLGTGAVAAFDAISSAVAANKDIVEAAGVAVVALGGAYAAVAAGGAVVTGITAVTTAFSALMAATAAARIAFVAMATTMGTIPAVFTVVRTAAIALYASLGPIGWIVAAIGAAAGGAAVLWLKHKAATDEAAASTAKFEEQLRDLQQRQQAVAAGPQAVAKLDQAGQIKEYRKALEEQHYTESQINQLVAARVKLQAQEYAAAKKIEDEGAKRAAQQAAEAKAEAERKSAATRAAAEARAEAKRRADAAKKAIQDAKDYVDELHLQTAQIGASTEQLKAMEVAAKAAAAPTKALRDAILSAGDAWEIAFRNDQTAQAMKPVLNVDTAGLTAVANHVGEIKTSAELLNEALADQINHWKLLRDQINDTGRAFESAFGNVGRGIMGAVDALLYYGQQDKKLLKEHQDKVATIGDNDQKLAEEQKRYANATAVAQVAAYGDILEASRNFFDQNSAGYKLLTKGVQAFRAVELALSIKSMAQDVAHTAASLANSAARTAAGAVEAVVNAIKSLPFPLNLAAGAATIAALGSIGVAIAGSFGGGGSKPTAPNEGKGTILGDADAQSQSLTRAIQALQDIDTLTLSVSRDMLSSLKSIETNIGGLSSLIVRTGNIDASAGITTGTSSSLLSSALGAAPGAAVGMALGSLVGGPVGAALGAALGGALGDVVKKIPIIGDIAGALGSVAKSLFGTKSSVVGSGIYGGSQSLGDIVGNGFDASYFSDAKKTKKFFGISTGSKYSTQYTDASDEIEDQFTQILSGFYKTIEAAAGPLGVATNDVEKRLDNFVVNIGKIDLQGLTGEEINDRLTAVFGSAADDIARAAVPGLERFQRVGEGYFETLTRVASTVETVSQVFGRLGANAQNLGIDASMGLTDAFGSLDDATSAASAYFETYFSEAEQTAAKTAELGKVFDALGLAMPDTLASFRSLVEAQDLTTASGQQTYAMLLQLAPAFADLKGAVQDATSAAAILRERQDLERQLLELQGDTNALRALDLSRLDASNRALQEQIWALTDQQAAAQAAAQAEEALAQQRAGLENQLLQLQGDTAEIRRRELDALDPSLRALQQRIYDLQDEQAAAQAAAQRAQQLADAWKSVGDSIVDEINRIRGLTAANDNTNLGRLQAQFDAATVAARGGDQTAAQGLTGLSQQLLDAATSAVASREELNRIQALTAGSLEETLRIIQAATGNAGAALTGWGANSSATNDNAAWWSSFSASGSSGGSNDAAINALRTDLQSLRVVIEKVATNSASMAKTLSNVTAEGGDAFSVRDAA